MPVSKMSLSYNMPNVSEKMSLSYNMPNASEQDVSVLQQHG